jgi:mannitol/fructose-specific phosphotransferase system IIA component
MSSTLHEALLGHQLVRHQRCNRRARKRRFVRPPSLLVAAGCVAPQFAESMIRREAVANTFLGASVAIPHGMGEDKHLVRSGTASPCCRCRAGWNGMPGKERAAGGRDRRARSDNHITILRRLTRLIQE